MELAFFLLLSRSALGRAVVVYQGDIRTTLRRVSLSEAFLAQLLKEVLVNELIWSVQRKEERPRDLPPLFCTTSFSMDRSCPKNLRILDPNPSLSLT